MTRTHRCTTLGFLGGLAALAGLAWAGPAQAQMPPAAPTPPAKSFIDYFKPVPASGPLSTTVWGAAAVGPRDTGNGVEDSTMTKWDYWDGKIIKGADGKYHLFSSRWDQSHGHNGWFGSQAVESVSNKLTGPYVDQGLLWPNDQGGKGHNVTALMLPDGRYAVVVSETRPGDVFASKSPNGPWEHLGQLQVAPGPNSRLGHMSNVSPLLRPDGAFEIIARGGAIWISKTGILGPYDLPGKSIYPTIPGFPQHDLGNLEDPCLWYSGGLYHVVVNNWSDRKAYHITSVNGIDGWTYQGIAYDPDKDFVRYTNGTVNHWNKMERLGVYLENGHVAAVTLAVIDVPKENENGNDTHGSKVIVIPFDGAAMDRDLAKSQSKFVLPFK